MFIPELKSKTAILIKKVALGNDHYLEVDTPVTLTGATKVCFGKQSHQLFLKVRVEPIGVYEGCDGPIFVLGTSLMVTT